MKIMLRNIRNEISKIFWSLWKPSEFLLEPFHPIMDDWNKIQRIKTEKYHLRYLSEFLTASYCIIETIILYLIFGYNIKESYLMQHVITSFMPEHYFSLMDILFNLVIILILFTSFNLMFEPNPHFVHVMFPLKRNSSLLRSSIEPKPDAKLSESLMNFRFKIQNKLQAIRRTMELQIYISYMFPLTIYELYRIFYIPGYKTQLRVWFCVIVSAKVAHDFMIEVMIGFYFITLNIFINIKQRYLLTTIQTSSEINSFYEFDKSLRKILLHIHEINSFNAFYSKYMTMLIFTYCFLGCCSLNGSIFSPESYLFIKIPWMLFSITYVIGIGAFAMASSRTIFLNRSIYLKLQEFQMSLCNRRTTPLRRNIAHLDLVNEYKTLLLSTCFRISTKTILDNKLWLFQITRYLILIYFKIVHKFWSNFDWLKF